MTAPSTGPSALGGAWGAGGCLGRADRRMPGAGRGKLEMAVSRLLDGKGAFRGGAIGRNPTDRVKAGSKKSILVDGGGGPLSAVVAGANVHDTKLLRLTLESIVVRRPEGAQNLCLDKGYDNPTGHGTVADTGYQPHIRRIGEEKLDQSGKKPIQPGGGCGTHPGMAVQVPGHTGAIRQKAIQLPWPAPTGFCPYLVPLPLEPRYFEIVTKHQR